MFCFVHTSPPLMLGVYLQTFEVALFWKKKKNVLVSAIFKIIATNELEYYQVIFVQKAYNCKT